MAVLSETEWEDGSMGGGGMLEVGYGWEGGWVRGAGWDEAGWGGRMDGREVGCEVGWMEGRLVPEKPLALYLPFSSHSNLKVRFSPCS